MGVPWKPDVDMRGVVPTSVRVARVRQCPPDEHTDSCILRRWWPHEIVYSFAEPPRSKQGLREWHAPTYKNGATSLWPT